MKRIFGRVLVKETNIGVANLVVAAFDHAKIRSNDRIDDVQIGFSLSISIDAFLFERHTTLLDVESDYQISELGCDGTTFDRFMVFVGVGIPFYSAAAFHRKGRLKFPIHIAPPILDVSNGGQRFLRVVGTDRYSS